VRTTTIQRFTETFTPYGFAAKAMYPAYGMAEGTVLIAARRRGEGSAAREISRAALLHHRADPPRAPDDRQTSVACGRALPGERIAIVDPETRARLDADRIGEIWAAGPNVGRGYWRNPEATEAAFAAEIVGEEGSGTWLRTGDLGFLDEDGELFITGRLKELIIIRGINHYPQDIENTVQRCHPALRPHGGAAFAAPDGSGAEALIVVQEVERTERHRVAGDDLVAAIREAVVTEHDIVPAKIVLIRPSTLPKTTSGKIQRGLTRRLWLDGSLEVL
jgi:acyl-CoA synthetase (AMP-forming)/AMP-acid ligase II